MSYDLRIGVRVHDTNIIAVIAEPDMNSPTYNLGKMFRACTGWDYEQGKWYRVEEVLPLIEHGIHELKFNGEAYKQYSPSNGWGTINSAILALESLEKCIQHQITGEAWQAVPIEHLWVAW